MQPAASPQPSRSPAADAPRPAVYVPLGLALLTVIAFLPVLRDGFVNFDDPQYVLANPYVRGGLSAAGLRWALTAKVADNWHPLTLASHMLDVQLFGLDPRWHHLTSLLLHLLTVLLVYEVWRRMTSAPWRSAAAAALYAVHPLRVESVAWIAERKDVLCGLCWMLTLAAWLRYTRRPSAGRYLPVAALFAASLMAKPMAVTLPLVLLLLDVWPLRRWRRAGAEDGRSARLLLAEKAPLAALALAAGVIALVTQSGPLASGATASLPLRLANAATSYVAYLGKTFYPAHLAVFYPFQEVPAGRAAAAVALLAAITAVALAPPVARRAPYLAVGWLWYGITLLPVCGILQVGWQSMADRYTYLPSIGLAVAVAWSAAALARRLLQPPWRQALPAAGAAAVLLTLAAMTRQQVRYWHDNLTLFQHSLTVEESFLADANVAEELRALGDRAGALARYRAAIAQAPRLAYPRIALGNALRAWGQPGAALAPLTDALALEPADERGRIVLAMALDDVGRPDLAIIELRRTLAYHPDSIDARRGLAALLQQHGPSPPGGGSGGGR
jgi:protein O-mannosyl-transferase